MEEVHRVLSSLPHSHTPPPLISPQRRSVGVQRQGVFRELRKDMGGFQSSCFYSKSQYKYDEADREPRYTSRKIRPSDEDRGRYVGELDVDTKASAFIAKFHESRFMDLESQTVAV